MKIADILKNMGNKTRSILSIAVAAVVLIIIFAVVLATSTDKTEQIYGVWKNTAGESEIYEFSPNGAVVLSNDKVNFSGKYTIDDEKIYVQLADREAECTYYFENDKLYIINEKGEKSCLEKVDNDKIIDTVSSTESSSSSVAETSSAAASEVAESIIE